MQNKRVKSKTRKLLKNFIFVYLLRRNNFQKIGLFERINLLKKSFRPASKVIKKTKKLNTFRRGVLPQRKVRLIKTLNRNQLYYFLKEIQARFYKLNKEMFQYLKIDPLFSQRNILLTSKNLVFNFQLPYNIKYKEDKFLRNYIRRIKVFEEMNSRRGNRNIFKEILGKRYFIRRVYPKEILQIYRNLRATYIGDIF